MILRDNIEYIFKTKRHEIYGKFTSTEYKREIEREREREYGTSNGKYLKHIQFGFRWNKVEGEKECNLMMINTRHY